MVETAQRVEPEDIRLIMAEIGHNARAGSRLIALAAAPAKDGALLAMADALDRSSVSIAAANRLDMAAAGKAGLSAAMLDRLQLDPVRIAEMADGIRAIAGLRDPVGEIIARWDRPNGLLIERVRTPLGVIGVIFESRPNVTADAGALCFKAGNASILRAGSDCHHSSRAIHACLVEGLRSAGLPEKAIQLVPTTDRSAVGEMLGGLGGKIDVIVPRGGKNLVARVQNEARVPVFAHLEGICHVYLDKSANTEMAVAVTMNSKMRRTGVCGSAETLLVDRAGAGKLLLPVLSALAGAGCQIRATTEICARFPAAIAAVDSDWTAEYLAPIIAVKLVNGIEGAIAHIETFSSHHTEAVIAEDGAVVSRFMAEIDSAILLHNASTQFADGGEFGMGAEIGIATGKMHARGPVGVEQLTSFKYRVRGNGQIRS